MALLSSLMVVYLSLVCGSAHRDVDEGLPFVDCILSRKSAGESAGCPSGIRAPMHLALAARAYTCTGLKSLPEALT